MNITDKGTVINNSRSIKNIKAVAAKDNITIAKIKSARMLMAYGFLSRIFEIFNQYKTAIDAIATSEVGVSLTIDNTLNLEKILYELKDLGEVEVLNKQSIICVVGEGIASDNKTVNEIISGLQGIPIQLISYGGSNINITLVVASENKIQVLNRIHNTLIKIGNVA